MLVNQLVKNPIERKEKYGQKLREKDRCNENLRSEYVYIYSRLKK